MQPPKASPHVHHPERRRDHGSKTTPAELQAERQKLRETVNRYEEVLAHAEAVLHAIDAGAMLAALPPDESDANLHNAACYLLDMLQGEILQCRQAAEA